MGSKKKGLEHELLFIIVIIIVVIIVVVSAWKYAGMSVASERMSELKINTVAQIKNILLLMQSAPVTTTACASLKNCNKVEIHNTYIEIWGSANNYFKEGAYLSTSLAGNMDLYMYDESSDAWDILTGDESFVTACGSGTSPIFVCFKKVDDKKIHILGTKGG